MLTWMSTYQSTNPQLVMFWPVHSSKGESKLGHFVCVVCFLAITTCDWQCYEQCHLMCYSYLRSWRPAMVLSQHQSCSSFSGYLVESWLPWELYFLGEEAKWPEHHHSSIGQGLVHGHPLLQHLLVHFVVVGALLSSNCVAQHMQAQWIGRCQDVGTWLSEGIWIWNTIVWMTLIISSKVTSGAFGKAGPLVLLGFKVALLWSLT